MYPSSENTSPNSTYNPTFELAYWQFGLKIASDWKVREGISVPESWTRVPNNLAPLPIVHGAYSICADLPGTWNKSSNTSDHPSQIAVYGLLPPTAGVDPTTVNSTMNPIAETWNFQAS